MSLPDSLTEDFSKTGDSPLSLSPKKERFILLLLAFVQFSHIVDFMIVMPLGPALSKAFEISPSQFSLLVSCYTFAAGISGLLSAFYADLFDRKKMLLFFYVGFCAGTIACALAQDYVTFVLARTLTGLFGGTLGSLTFAIVADLIPAKRRGSAMGLVMTSFSLASVLGVPFSLFLASHFEWHAPFYFLGILSSFFIFGILKLLPSINQHMTLGKDGLARAFNGREAFTKILNLLKNRNAAFGLIFMSLLMLSHFVTIPFLSQCLLSNAGLSPDQLPYIYLVGGACTIFSSPFIGKLCDKWGSKKVFTIGLFGSLVPMLLITHLTTVQPVIWLLTLAAAFFVLAGGRMIPAQSLISQLCSPQNRGTYMSLISSVQQFAAATAALIAGSIVVKLDTGAFVNYNYVGYVSLIFSIMAFGLIGFLKTDPNA